MVVLPTDHRMGYRAVTYDPFLRPADRPQPQRRPLWTFQKADCIYTCELVLHDGFGSEARILKDGDLLLSRRFEQEWQTLQWAEEERRFIEIRERTGEGPADVSSVMATVNGLLDSSIAADGFRVRKESDGEGHAATIDLSAIDFEVLAKRFPKAQRKNVELEQLRAAVRAQLERLIRVNRTRADYQQKFEELIESYNVGSRNIDELFKELLALSRALSEEQHRHVREQLTEEELTVFDLLTRPGPDLSPEERAEVKKVARHLLERVRNVLVLNWRHKAQARAQVKLAIEDTLEEGLPRSYTPDVYKSKCAVLFEHIFETFSDVQIA
jgi:type I restriction enzyme, R subunit